MADSRRVRVRRTNADKKLTVRSSKPKWKTMDIVRFNNEEMDRVTKNALVGEHETPDFYTVLAVRPDEGAADNAKDLSIDDPGRGHHYVLRSYLTGKQLDLPQCLLTDVDAKYRRYIVAFFKGHLVKVTAALNDHLGIYDEPEREDDHDLHDEEGDEVADDEEEAVAYTPRRMLRDTGEEEEDSNDFFGINRPRRGRGVIPR